MRPDDPSLKRMTPPKLNFLEKTYIPQILSGLVVTGRHILARRSALGSSPSNTPKSSTSPRPTTGASIA